MQVKQIMSQIKMRGPRSNTRQQIQEAAVKLFFRKGYAATGIREIATAAGVQVATLYNHFPSKQQLLVETLVEKGLEQNEELKAALDALSEDPFLRLQTFVRVKVCELSRPLTETTVIDTELRSVEPENRARVLEVRDWQDQVLDLILTDGVRAGLWQNSGRLARLFIFQVTNIRQWYRPSGPLSLDEIAQQCLHFVLGGLSTRNQPCDAPLQS